MYISVELTSCEHAIGPVSVDLCLCNFDNCWKRYFH